MGAMIRNAGIFLLLFFCLSCFKDNEKIQYIAVKNGENLEPYARVIYRVSVDRQEVVYWIEFPGKAPSLLYKLEKCIVADMNNWGGEAKNILLWEIRVELVNGHFSSPGEALVNVDWFTWHFRTDPSPSNLLTIVASLVIVLGTIGIIIISLLFIIRLRKWEEKRIEKTAERWSGKIGRWPK
jgi:hypothetical protein